MKTESKHLYDSIIVARAILAVLEIVAMLSGIVVWIFASFELSHNEWAFITVCFSLGAIFASVSDFVRRAKEWQYKYEFQNRVMPFIYLLTPLAWLGLGFRDFHYHALGIAMIIAVTSAIISGLCLIGFHWIEKFRRDNDMEFEDLLAYFATRIFYA